jgi:cytochrome c551/c552
MAMAEVLRGVQRNSVGNKSQITVKDQEEALSKLLQNSRNGMVYNWIPVVVLGQKKEQS